MIFWLFKRSFWRKPKTENLREEELPKEPISTLDEIIHDSQWYSPKKKNGNKDKKHAAE